jgi:hypothetical protein
MVILDLFYNCGKVGYYATSGQRTYYGDKPAIDNINIGYSDTMTVNFML